MASSNDSVSRPGGLIFHARDFKGITSTAIGSKIMQRLGKMIAYRRRKGQRILLIGTIPKKIPVPAPSTTGPQGPEGKYAGVTGQNILLLPSNCLQENLLKEDKAKWIKEVNTRLIKSVFRSSTDKARHLRMFAPRENWDLTNFPAFSSKLANAEWTPKSVHRIVMNLL